MFGFLIYAVIGIYGRAYITEGSQRTWLGAGGQKPGGQLGRRKDVHTREITERQDEPFSSPARERMRWTRKAKIRGTAVSRHD